jgi:hypothetical protein
MQFTHVTEAGRQIVATEFKIPKYRDGFQKLTLSQMSDVLL